MNKHFTYKNIDLWRDDNWADKISGIDGLVKWYGENMKRNDRVYSHPVFEKPTEHPNYRVKTLSIDEPEVIKHWADQGIRLTVLEAGGKRWISMVPEKAMKQRDKKLPALVVYHQEDYSDPWWAMRTVDYFRAYNEMIAASQDMVIIYIITDGPDKDRMSFNIMTEALVLYPTDTNRVFFDVSFVYESGNTLNKIPNFIYKDVDGHPIDPDKAVTAFGALNIPVLNVAGRWGSRDSLTRACVMKHAGNEGLFNREWLIHSITGKKMMDGIVLEHLYDDINNPELLKYWENMGLKFEIHHKNGERWITLTPLSAIDNPDKKLPVILLLQEVYPGNEHLAVTAMSYCYEFTEIAAQGECILLFFVLEDPDSNDLLADILEDAAAMFPIDKSRVYAAGHSHDSWFARIFAYRHPDKVAALAILGQPIGLASLAEWGNPVAATEDSQLEGLSKIEMPIIIVGGEVEFRYFDGNEAWIRKFARAWQRRLTVCNCPVKTFDEIRAARTSANKVERKIGVPLDRTEVLWMEGFEHYIGDVLNDKGQQRLRAVRVDNIPHTVHSSMVTLSWSFMRRFARDQETGEAVELF